VPDLYQCSESWLRPLVDPDNRRPLAPAGLRSTVDTALADGPVWGLPAPKAAVIARLLELRRRNLASFDVEPAYRPLDSVGAYHDHLIAYERGPNVAVIASRFPAARPDGWAGTTIDVGPGAWRDILSDRQVDGGSLHLADLLGDRPAAVLERIG
jgi:(1->4)-alpha-D-glucan 1-alpha-D-glucosylmutase